MDTIDLFKSIDKNTLLNAINNAKLVIVSDSEKIELGKYNSLFGCSDYLLHQKDTIEKATEILNSEVSDLSVFDLKQNLNYYRNGIIFDYIVYSGYRGGYNFSVGFSTDKQQKNSNESAWNDLIVSSF